MSVRPGQTLPNAKDQEKEENIWRGKISGHWRRYVERRSKKRKICGGENDWRGKYLVSGGKEEVKGKRRKIFGEGKSDDGQRNRISSFRLDPFCGKGRVKAFDATVKVYLFGHKHTRTTGETAASFERVPRGWSCQYIFNWICLTPPLQFNFSDNISD